MGSAAEDDPEAEAEAAGDGQCCSTPVIIIIKFVLFLTNFLVWVSRLGLMHGLITLS